MAAEAGSSEHWKPEANPWLIAATVALAAFMEVLDTSIANVALPHIAGDLGASTSQGTWVLTSYLVSNAIILPVGAWASSVIGRKEFLSALYHHLHRRKLSLRYRANTSTLASGASLSRRRRWRAPADGAGDHGGFVFRTAETRPSLRALWSRRRTCTVPRTDDPRWRMPIPSYGTW